MAKQTLNPISRVPSAHARLEWLVKQLKGLPGKKETYARLAGALQTVHLKGEEFIGLAAKGNFKAAMSIDLQYISPHHLMRAVELAATHKDFPTFIQHVWANGVPYLSDQNRSQLVRSGLHALIRTDNLDGFKALLKLDNSRTALSPDHLLTYALYHEAPNLSNFLYGAGARNSVPLDTLLRLPGVIASEQTHSTYPGEAHFNLEDIRTSLGLDPTLFWAMVKSVRETPAYLRLQQAV